MSNTYKDRPFWVKLNDAKHTPVHTHHDHLDANTPIYEYRKVKDENGNQVYETRTHNYIELEWTLQDGSKKTLPRYMGMPEGAKAVVEVTLTRSWKVKKTERVLIGYTPDHCTEGQKVTGKMNHLTGSTENLCYPQLSYSTQRGMRKGDNAEHWGSVRNKKRSNTRNLRVSYNNGNDLWDDDSNEDYSSNFRKF